MLATRGVREYVRPRNPRTTEHQSHRDNVRAVTGRWRTPNAEQRAAWCIAAANHYFVTETGRRVRLNGYHHFVSLNVRRADLGLPQFDLPPAEPVFSPNPVAELVITNTGGKITLKLRVPSPPRKQAPFGAACRLTTPLSELSMPLLTELENHFLGWLGYQHGARGGAVPAAHGCERPGPSPSAHRYLAVTSP